MKVLITGGNSAIGRHLSDRLLAENHEVVSFDIQQPKQRSPKITYTQGDIRDSDLVYKVAEGCDTGIHLAILAGNSQDIDIMSVNILGAYSFYKTALKRNFRMSVLASSAPVHLPPDKADTKLPLRTEANDIYDLSKKLQEMIAQDYHAHGLPTICLRFGHIVRGHEKLQLNSNSSLEDLDYCRGGWVALEDVVSSCLSALKSTPDEFFHPYHIVGSKYGRERFKTMEAEQRFGISLAYDFSEFE